MSLYDVCVSMGWCVCTSAANKCLLKVAQYAAQVEHYEKAIDIYEQVNRLICTFSPTALVVQVEHSVCCVRVSG